MYCTQVLGILALFFICGSNGYVASDLDDRDGGMSDEDKINIIYKKLQQLTGKESKEILEEHNVMSSTTQPVVEEEKPEISSLEEDLDNTDAEVMENPPFLRYVGVGYDLIKGSPEGGFNGGVDPGIKRTRQIFGFTYEEGKTFDYFDRTIDVPDEVSYNHGDSCSNVVVTSVFSGAKSYQASLMSDISAEGGYGGFSFSGSAAIARASESTESSKTILTNRKNICNYGTIRYKDTGTPLVTKDFYESFLALPSYYSSFCDNLFMEKWGTHIITEVNIGTRTIQRYAASYEDAFSFQLSSNSVSAGGGYSGPVVSGSVEVNLKTLNEMSNKYTILGTMSNEIRMGSKERPVPIFMVLTPIYRALERKYWENHPLGDVYDSENIAQRMENLKISFEARKSSSGKTLSDPSITVPLTWPSGKWSLPEPREGCEPGFTHGCRGHDTQGSNAFTNAHLLTGSFQEDDINMCYCTKTSDITSPFRWPEGRYCIARYGNVCPADFQNGQIYWDDEDSNNQNTVTGIIPDGTYDSNTEIQYCCRSDGDTEKKIDLPNMRSFVLYQYSYKGCQEVSGMSSEEVMVMYDNEDTFNGSKCSGTTPYDNNDCKNHRIYMCYYFPAPQI